VGRLQAGIRKKREVERRRVLGPENWAKIARNWNDFVWNTESLSWLVRGQTTLVAM
jgi:hypothetical protein